MDSPKKVPIDPGQTYCDDHLILQNVYNHVATLSSENKGKLKQVLAFYLTIRQLELNKLTLAQLAEVFAFVNNKPTDPK